MPMIRMTGSDGHVIYEGEGELVVSTDFSRPPERQDPGAVVLRGVLPDGGFQADLTELCRQFPHHWLVEYPVPEPEPDGTQALCVGTPEPSHYRVEFELPPGMAEALAADVREQIRRQMRDARLDRPMDEVLRDWNARSIRPGDEVLRDLWPVDPDDFGQAIDPETWARVQREARRAAEGLQAMREQLMGAYDVPAHLADNEDLIRSTRDEFPYDPYDYGRIHPTGMSRWTPPEDPDEEIPSCPA